MGAFCGACSTSNPADTVHDPFSLPSEDIVVKGTLNTPRQYKQSSAVPYLAIDQNQNVNASPPPKPPFSAVPLTPVLNPNPPSPQHYPNPTVNYRVAASTSYSVLSSPSPVSTTQASPQKDDFCAPLALLAPSVPTPRQTANHLPSPRPVQQSALTTSPPPPLRVPYKAILSSPRPSESRGLTPIPRPESPPILAHQPLACLRGSSPQFDYTWSNAQAPVQNSCHSPILPPLPTNLVSRPFSPVFDDPGFLLPSPHTQTYSPSPRIASDMQVLPPTTLPFLPRPHDITPCSARNAPNESPTLQLTRPSMDMSVFRSHEHIQGDGAFQLSRPPRQASINQQVRSRSAPIAELTNCSPHDLRHLKLYPANFAPPEPKVSDELDLFPRFPASSSRECNVPSPRPYVSSELPYRPPSPVGMKAHFQATVPLSNRMGRPLSPTFVPSPRREPLFRSPFDRHPTSQASVTQGVEPSSFNEEYFMHERAGQRAPTSSPELLPSPFNEPVPLVSLGVRSSLVDFHQRQAPDSGQSPGRDFAVESPIFDQHRSSFCVPEVYVFPPPSPDHPDRRCSVNTDTSDATSRSSTPVPPAIIVEPDSFIHRVPSLDLKAISAHSITSTTSVKEPVVLPAAFQSTSNHNMADISSTSIDPGSPLSQGSSSLSSINAQPYPYPSLGTMFPQPPISTQPAQAPPARRKSSLKSPETNQYLTADNLQLDIPGCSSTISQGSSTASPSSLLKKSSMKKSAPGSPGRGHSVRVRPSLNVVRQVSVFKPAESD